MPQTILFIIFLIITVYSGYAFSRLVLKENRIFVLVPLSLIIGINGYNFLVNIVGHFIPLNISAWIMIVAFFVCAAVVSFKNWAKLVQPHESILTKKQYRIIFSVAVVVSILSGIVAFRALALDDLLLPHLPLASTIVDGNFPAMDPSAPDHPMAYHYASDLLSVLFHEVTGTPLWFGYDIQMLVFSGALFLMIFAFLYEYTKRFGISVIGSLLFLYGTGLQWVYFFTEGIPALWQKFILHIPVDAPWKFVASMIFPKMNTSYVYAMNNHSLAMGMPVLFLVLFLYFKAITEQNTRKAITVSIIGSVCYGYLAFNIETYFILIYIALLGMIGAYLMRERINYFKEYFVSVNKRFVAVTLMFLVLSLPIAFYQGGVLSSVFSGEGEHFTLHKTLQDFTTLDLGIDMARVFNPNLPPNPKDIIPVFSFEFLIQFGFPLILFIPAVYYFRKNYTLMFLVLIATGSFVVPFLFRYTIRPWEMTRFFTFAIPLFSILVGMFLVEMYLKYIRVNKAYTLLIFGILFCITISGILVQMLFSISPMDRFGKINVPFFATPPAPLAIDSGPYNWIKSNTTIKDRFFPYDYNFIRDTGRFAVGAPRYVTFSQREREINLYDKTVESCSEESIKESGATYFYVTPDFPIKNPKECLIKLNAEKVYESVAGSDFRQIYRIK